MARLDVRERDFDEWDSLNMRFFARVDSTARPPAGIAIISAAGRKDSAAVRRHVEEIVRRRLGVGYTSRELVRVLWEVEVAERLARFATAPDRSPGMRADGHLVLAEIALGQGRWKAAQPHLTAAEQIDAVRGRLMRGAAATLAFARWPREDLERIERDLAAWDPSAQLGAPNPSPVLLLLPHIRLYFLGLLRSQLGDWPRALSRAEELQRTHVPEWLSRTRDELAVTVRADVAWRQGDAARELSLLEPLRGEVPLDVLPGGNVPRLGDHILSQEHARFLRADALLQLGETDEAVRWLTASFTLMPGEFIYRAPVELRLAQMHDRAGRRELALAHYTKFLELWDSADGELQPVVSGVRRRVAELGG